MVGGDVWTFQALAHTLANLTPRMPQTAAKVRRMLWQLYTTGFAAF